MGSNSGPRGEPYHSRIEKLRMIDYQTYYMGKANDVLVIAVSGRLDNDTSDFFFDCVKGHIEEGNTKLVIDFRNVKFISSVGLSTLVRTHTRMKRIGGDVKLARMEGVLVELISTVGLNKVFQLYPSVREACEAFDA